MLFFTLAQGADKGLRWFCFWCNEENPSLEALAEVARAQCREAKCVYVCMWGFKLIEKTMTLCRNLHERFGDKFRLACMGHFSTAYEFIFGTPGQHMPSEIKAYEQTILAAAPDANLIFSAAAAMGISRATADKADV